MARAVRDAGPPAPGHGRARPRDPLSIDAPPEDYLAACDGDLKGLRVVWSADLGYAPWIPRSAGSRRRRCGASTELGARVEERAPGWPDPTDSTA